MHLTSYMQPVGRVQVGPDRWGVGSTILYVLYSSSCVEGFGQRLCLKIRVQILDSSDGQKVQSGNCWAVSVRSYSFSHVIRP